MNNISDADLRRLFLFGSVNPESIRGVLDACTLRLAAPGEVIIHAGSPNRHIYLILDGRLHIHPDCLSEEPLAVLGPGEMVGEMSVIDHQPASANVVAVEPCRIMVMEEDILWSLIQSSHDAARNLLFILTRRLRHADQVITGNVAPGEGYEQYGSVDALTGLRGRKWLDHVIQRQFLRSKTCGEPLSMILIDIDHFKAFNSKHGHAYGDRVL
ncbi:MAG: GGDEF domain-containing protein, partial [Syntrophus sp. (in: bacteria)]|nr:GGDEF domain-containing protein [Syntrophus sp. (in: bacteria)]